MWALRSKVEADELARVSLSVLNDFRCPAYVAREKFVVSSVDHVFGLKCLRRPDQHHKQQATDQFQEIVDSLRQALAFTLPSIIPPVTPSTSVCMVSLMANPAPYSGSEEDCSRFLTPTILNGPRDAAAFPTETSKISFANSLLSGSIWEMYHLKQAKMSVTYYVFCFRTLAATSGWNECLLLAAYQQILKTVLHFAAYNDSISLERFIQLSIRISYHMQTCMKELMGQQSSIYHQQPMHASAPEPPTEPMILDGARLSLT
ncbi:Leukotriene A-4 hydrolase [Labeo rohita]|uniref:Leukotriene A-4 hydrolase n=1 Tax=Labeo rohita TaxID=84645 RepID=A0ABQ8LYL3_LABRO|nr:Leukotriene A-4 hydrolase [Labeo rohita]